MKALGLVVSDKKIFESCILKTYFLTRWPTYATNWNGLNNFVKGPPRDHSCEVWSKSNKRFQRRCCLKKLLTHGRRTLKDHKSSLEHFVLRWAKNIHVTDLYKLYSINIAQISYKHGHKQMSIVIDCLINLFKADFKHCLGYN